DRKLTVIPVYLEDVELTPGLRVALSRVQALQGFRLTADELDVKLRLAIRDSEKGVAPPEMSPRVAPLRRWSGTRLSAAVGTAIAALIAVASVFWWWLHAHSSETPPTRSIAVLPFTAMSDEAQVRHLADATVDEVLNDLAKKRDLEVASRTESAIK